MKKKVFVEKKWISSESCSIFIRATFLQAASSLLRKKHLNGLQHVKFVLSNCRRMAMAMAIQRQIYMKRKAADHSLILEWASVWLQNTDDPGSAILSDRVTAELIISRLCKVQPWRRSRICRSAVASLWFFRTHNNASLNTGDTERLLALLEISMLHRTLVSKNTQKKIEDSCFLGLDSQ